MGHELSFLAHITKLKDFSAVETETVRLALTGPDSLDVTAPMLRSGIYLLEVAPRVAGTYQATFSVGDLGVVGPIAIEIHPTESDAANAAPEDETDDIAFLKEQQWRVPFATAFAERARVRPSVEVSGELTAPPGGVAQLPAPVAGRIVAPPGGFPALGTPLAANTLLATLAPTPGSPEESTRARLAVVEAEARVEASQVEVARAERLLADEAIPGRRLDEARRELKVAEAGLEAARRTQSLYAAAQRGRGQGSWRVTSPIAGVLDAVDVSPGEAVDAGEHLFRVVDTRVLWVTASLPEAWAEGFVPDANASFQLLGGERWLPIDLSGDASLVHASRTVDAVSRTVRVVYALGAPEAALRVGAAVRVLVPTGEPVESVTVPRSAIVEIEGRQVVYVQTNGESFEERAVRPGPYERDLVAIVAGLESGERVVTRGAHLVRLAGSSGAVGHGHVH
ncbi:MAG: efflux RND transporter periplasmic adaptor subunit [Myxococcota bacterium]